MIEDDRKKQTVLISFQKATNKLFLLISVENNIDVWYIATYMMFSMENMQARWSCP